LQVLIAYLDRNHADWRDVAGEKASQSSSTPPQLDDSHMTRPLALEILGLSDPVEEKEIADSHRALMQKLHPDRGGSGYLAKKINAARDFLLDD
jgi:DnaJ-class molecular chaperone